MARLSNGFCGYTNRYSPTWHIGRHNRIRAYFRVSADANRPQDFGPGTNVHMPRNCRDIDSVTGSNCHLLEN
jgi:hypothetical protein